jgi:hypothetical protein
MHDVAIDELERHLSGNASSTFYAHLAVCEECRTEVGEMENLSAMFRELRAEVQSTSAPEPRLGFYNRVAGEIIGHQRTDFLGLFAPGAAFFRRVAFTSLLMLAGLGSYLVSHESSFPAVAGPAGGMDPAWIMASHDPSVEHPADSDRDRLLLTLATYNPQP